MDNFKDWPEVCHVGPFIPSLSLSSLLPDQKVTLWRHLKSVHPQKANEIAILMGDSKFQLLISEFTADLMLEEQFVPPELRWLLRR